MIFIVNNQSLDDALNDPNNANTRNSTSAKYKKSNSHNNTVHPSGHQKFHHSVSQSSNHHKITPKNPNHNDQQKSDYCKDIMARLFAVLSFILIGAGIGLLVFGILKSKLKFHVLTLKNIFFLFFILI
jgi:hypothetical protein